MKQEAWLERAAQRLFVGGVGDVAEQLCRANMTYGIAKILYAEHWAALEPQALFIGAPDATVTRNNYRWRHGFGYGGLVRWNPDLAVLDAKPNGCGMLVGALHAAPDARELLEAAASVKRSDLELDGVKLTYDLGESNHFVDVLEIDQMLHPVQGGSPPADHLFVIHSSGHEHRPASPLGPGLYVDESDQLRQLAVRLPTPWGPVSLLQGKEARRYQQFCIGVQDFNQRRRELYARLLFGDHEVVSNPTHQGIREPGCFHLGAYWFDRTDQLFPLTLGPDQPVYLLQPLPNLSLEVIQQLGWADRASRLDLLQVLQRANILPHGGGYAYPGLERLLRVESKGDRRVFWLEPRDGGLPIGVEDIRDLPFVYRDLAVLHRLMDLRLATPVARYRIRQVVRE